MPFLCKIPAFSSSVALTDSSNSTSSINCQLFANFDEKKDYVRRCSLKVPKTSPRSETFCLSKKL